MTTVSALKNLYVKLGGNLSDVAEINTVAEMIEAVKTVAGEGGGSDLPAVSSDDNGDILAVVEGAWAKVTPSSEVLVVPYAITIDEETHNPSATTDVAYSDILAAINANKAIIANVTGAVIAQCASVYFDSDNSQILFSLTAYNGEATIDMAIVHASSGTIGIAKSY